jgi:hypothetical protein
MIKVIKVMNKRDSKNLLMKNLSRVEKVLKGKKS